MEEVVISVLGGVASIEFQTDDVNVAIIDMDNDETYLYKDEYICVVTNINTDGTVDIKTIGNISGKKDRRIFMDVRAVDLEYYNLVLMDEDYDILIDEEVD